MSKYPTRRFQRNRRQCSLYSLVQQVLILKGGGILFEADFMDVFNC